MRPRKLKRIPLQNAGYSHNDITAIEKLLNSKEIPWLRINDEGILEFIVDNYLLSNFRSCQQYFFYSNLEGYKLNGSTMPWFLEFGIIFHKMIESYYTHFRDSDFKIVNWAAYEAGNLWQEMDMDKHKQHKDYIAMKGSTGFSLLLGQYAGHFSADNERLRIIGQEIAFGRGREVPLIDHTTENKIFHITYPFRAYLSGRIDVLVDDGLFISPMDHKTVGEIKKDTAATHRITEGPTGYIYAVNHMLPKVIPPDMVLRRKCNRILMNYVAKKEADKPQDRFSRIQIYKTAAQLEEYRIRMVQTCDDILRALVRYLHTKQATHDDSKCEKWMYHVCGYNQICRQNDEDNRRLIINSFYQIAPLWDTENREGD